MSQTKAALHYGYLCGSMREKRPFNEYLLSGVVTNDATRCNMSQSKLNIPS